MSNKSLSAKFRKAFEKLVNCNIFKLKLKFLNLDQYKFEILNKNHRNEAIALIKEQFSFKGGNFENKTFNLQQNDRINDEITVDHAIKSGISFVIKNAMNVICFVYIQFDQIDEPDYSQNKQSISMRYLKQKEMGKLLNLTDKWYQINVINNKSIMKKGEYIHVYQGATKHNLVQKHIAKLAVSINRAVFVNIDTVKYVHAEAVHPVTVYFADILYNKFFNQILRINDNNDDDNYFSITNRLNVYRYLKHKFLTDEWFKNNLNEDKVFNDIDGLNEKSEIIHFYIRYDQLRKRYKMEHVFEQFVNFVFPNQSKL